MTNSINNDPENTEQPVFPIVDRYPLSPLQQGMLFHTLYTPGQGVDVEQIVVTWQEAVDAAALTRAWHQLLGRHPVLRTAFRWQDRAEPVQEVYEGVPFSLTRRDWRHLSPEAQQTELATYLAADRRQGFAMDRPPLLRVTLLRLGRARYQLVWSFHHILLDGRSFPLLLEELFTRYEVEKSGRELTLPPPLPYRTYIDWLAQQTWPDAAAYWQKRLAGYREPLVLNLALPAPRAAPLPPPLPAATTARGEQRLRFSATDTARLEKFAGEQQLTLNTLLQGAWALLLHRYSGRDDLVFGVTRATRHSALGEQDAGQIVGLLINTLPLRVRCPAGMLVRDWLQEIRARWLEMRPYEHVPLARVQAWSELPSGSNLFDTHLVFERETLNDRLGDERRHYDLHERTAYALELAAYGGRHLRLALAYDRQWLDEGMATRALGHLRTLLLGMTAAAGRPLRDLPLLTSEERRLLETWNDTARPFPATASIPALVRAQAARTPRAVAVHQPAGPDSVPRSLTYAALAHRAEQIAAHLRRLGAGPEMRVGITTTPSLEMIVGLLGILQAGAAYVPLDPTYPPERLAYMIADSALRLLVAGPGGEEAVQRAQPSFSGRVIAVPPVAGISDPGAPLPSPPDLHPENSAYVIYTSGSTGRPKGVVIPQRALVNHATTIAEAYSLTPADRILQFASISFDVAGEEVWPALITGATVVLRPPEQALAPFSTFHRFLEEQRLTVLNLPTAYWHAWADALALAPALLPPALRLVVTGTEAARPQALATWEAIAGPGLRWHNAYGPTETTVTATLYTPTSAAELPETGAIPIGRPLPNVRAYILDDHLRPVPIGVPGELYLAGAGVARGYLNRPALTAAAFPPDPFAADGSRFYATGDLAAYRPDGNIAFLGRRDDQVKIRGFRVEPGEIQTVLAAHPRVKEGFVTAATDAAEPYLVAYVVAVNPESGTGLRAALGAYLEERLPAYMLPAIFLFLPALPRLPGGKVDARSLPAAPRARPDGGDYVSPRTPVEKVLCRVWASVLDLDAVGVEDDFFELGGDSILSIQIVARAHQAGLTLTPRQIFERRTIAALAPLLPARPALQAATPTAEQGIVAGPLPLTPIQHWFFEQPIPHRSHWNMSLLLLPATERLEPELLAPALTHLLHHHDALRLRFHRGQNRWRQENAPPPPTAPDLLRNVDLAALPPAEQTDAIVTHAGRAHTSLDLAQGPLLRAVLFDLGPGRTQRLLLIVHHLAIDGVSWRILLEDLRQAYQALRRREPVTLPPKTTSYRAWARALATYAGGEESETERAYWTGRPWHQAPPLPRDQAGANLEGSAATVIISLTVEETTSLLHEVPAAYQSEINDVLLTALVQALAPWTGQHTLLLEMEGHGREQLFPDFDLSRTVGWFTSAFPLLLSTPGTGEPGTALKQVKEELRALPRRGNGYGILRYLHPDPAVRSRLRRLPEPEITFNYLGQFDQPLRAGGFRFAPEASGPDFDPAAQRPRLLEINSSVRAGRLQLAWTYSKNIHHRHTVEAVAHRYLAALRRLIEHCLSPAAGGFTPSDFPDANLTQDELNDLLAELEE